MKTFASFDNQDTALEFDRILRNLARRQIVREITGGLRKSSDGKYVIGWKTGRHGCSRHVVNLLRKGNWVVGVSAWHVSDMNFVDETIATEVDQSCFRKGTDDRAQFEREIGTVVYYTGLAWAGLQLSTTRKCIELLVTSRHALAAKAIHELDGRNS